uniref:Fibrinogen C-terminal domain-containing protein n=1 Tax=Amphimedon queenslandica TaxID=400682 RepID=A0A1X7SU21_AMPQE
MEVKQKYEVMPSDPVQSQENQYEMVPVDTNARRTSVTSTEEVLKQSAWSKPFAVIAVLLCLIVFLLVVILCLLLVLLSAKDATSTSSTATTGAIASSCAKCSDVIVNKVNSNVTGSLPDFNEWANDVAQNTFELLQSSPNFTELNEQILQTTTNSAQKLINIVNTLSNLEDTSTSTAGVVDDILLIAQELLILHNDSTALPTSCKEIKETQPLSLSGVYLLANTTATYSAYCNMEELCGSGGGWTRLSYLDMTDSTENCPSEFRLYQSGGVRACGRTTSSGGSCVSVQFPSNGISYSQVCGRVVGYQYASPDAVYPVSLIQVTMISILIMLMVLVSLVGLLVNMSGH